MSDKSAPLLSRCLSLDLEVGVQSRHIRALAGVRPDTGRSVVLPSNRDGLAAALVRLDDIADGAEFLLGHNLILFDLHHLRAANPGLRLLLLPAVDTLMLNPLAFPRNPYHHLVKHYQDGQPQTRSHQRPQPGRKDSPAGLCRPAEGPWRNAHGLAGRVALADYPRKRRWLRYGLYLSSALAEAIGYRSA